MNVALELVYVQQGGGYALYELLYGILRAPKVVACHATAIELEPS